MQSSIRITPAADAAFETVKGFEAAGYLTIMDQALVRKRASGEVSVDEETTCTETCVKTGIA